MNIDLYSYSERHPKLAVALVHIAKQEPPHNPNAFFSFLALPTSSRHTLIISMHKDSLISVTRC